ncbi:MAG: hypothetical protein H6632_04355 [Anaerolineales bacterium]|nr:hypothetical protein [Anaerolineales bacterium]
MIQRKTQTSEYWQQQFKVSHKDIESIYQQILEQNRPVELNDIAIALVRRHCNEEELQVRSEFQDGKLYQPGNSYKVDEKLVFPALNFATGTVTRTRSGQHPDYGKFTVITVNFGNGSTKDFVANFTHEHRLNADQEQGLASLQGLAPPDEIYQEYEDIICNKIRAALEAHSDFVSFNDKYFLSDLLTEFHEGLFNIADAAIDINKGPLATDALIEQMGLVESADQIIDLMRFSVNYRLDSDERFEDVGPEGQVLWYLERMAPPEAYYPPRRLQMRRHEYDASDYDADLFALLSEIDDEATPADEAELPEENARKVTVVINYPHWRVGTLPLTPKMLPFFPKSYHNPVRFLFVDGRTGEKFPGWTVFDHKYVFGLDDWYKKNKLPVGAYITVRSGKDPMEVIVEFQATRGQRDWVRMVTISGNRLSFQMTPAAIGCKYDELMIIGDNSPESTDKFWLNAEDRDRSIFDLLCEVFPELSKLNPQSTVHAKTLYSAVNVYRRIAPGVVFQELISRQCFIPMNHGYWTYDPSLRDK